MGQPLSPSSRLNVRWSWVTINGLAIGMTPHTGAHSPQACHEALGCENLVYRALKVTALPSWVRTPSTLLPGSTSSVVVAFEDLDGVVLAGLLAQRTLYAFRHAGAVRQWKKPPRVKKLAVPATTPAA
ncbi:hypothetical protein B0F90DRAFT_1792037 [Multifurca ochricompacta]|uniref:Uncharacterized protein n=1 Tax=Multifurca ochricompacta TaxID=376703 RepID=A0AAD4QIP3_9AGAM|nr:hypothetical protein B0F90DRAFT_1792037 [Multifurca ochricompacta]